MVSTPYADQVPAACRHCPIPEREHMQRWSKAAGWHQWTAPTDKQRLDRMRARRDANEETR